MKFRKNVLSSQKSIAEILLNQNLDELLNNKFLIIAHKNLKFFKIVRFDRKSTKSILKKCQMQQNILNMTLLKGLQLIMIHWKHLLENEKLRVRFKKNEVEIENLDQVQKWISKQIKVKKKF